MLPGVNSYATGCMLRTEDIDALVLKHQAISILSTDEMLMVLDQFHTKILCL